MLGDTLYRQLSYSQLLSAVILYSNEMSKDELSKIKAINLLSKDYGDKERKFMLKTTLFDFYWRRPKAVEQGFFIYLEEKLSDYYHLENYHKKNCKGSCDICSHKQKVSEYLGVM